MKRKRLHYQAIIAIILILLCVLLFCIHFIMFGQIENTLYYATMSFCFIPLNTLVVTIVFESVYKQREKLKKANKSNMLIGVYFSELGYDLLHILAHADPNSISTMEDITDEKFINELLDTSSYSIDYSRIDFVALEKTLFSNKTLLITLMGNESLLEHETFSDLLFATMHLRDELIYSKDNKYVSASEAHIAEDALRVYKALVIQWWHYAKHLKITYPFLYQSAILRNPYVIKKTNS